MAPLSKQNACDSAIAVNYRIRHPKVKTGCITCRIRRVKCDETKPKCMRCCKYGTECGGYPPTPSKNSIRNSKQNRILIPKLQSIEGHTWLPALNLFESEAEKQYFNVFSNQIAAAIFPYFNCESWIRIINQACTTNSSIRHAAIAIGALGKTYEIARLCKKVGTGERVVLDVQRLSGSEIRLQSTSSDDLDKQANVHHRQALEQYDKAIRIMRNDLENGDQDIRTSLIICMIINCFEHIHGNHRSAAIQAQAGLAMVHEFQSQAQHDDSFPQGYSSPCPNKIEDFLVQSFGRLEIQSMSVFDPRPQEVHIKLKNEGKETINKMPKKFQNLEQSRNYLELITRRIMHFNGTIHVPRVNPTATSSMPYPSPVLNMLPQSGNRNHNPIPWIELKIPLANAQKILSSETLNKEKEELVKELDMWSHASNELLQFSMNRCPQDAISALALQIAALKTRITILSSLFLNESAYDTLYPEFSQIVQFADQLVNLQKTQESMNRNLYGPKFSTINMNFSFDLAIIPALYIVMIKCRYGPTRHKALNLLRENPRREGVWDSAASSGLGAWVIELEEEAARQILMKSSTSPFSAKDHDLALSSEMTPLELLQSTDNNDDNLHNFSSKFPEEIRIRGAQMRFDLLERRASLECTQIDINTGKFIRKKGTFSW
ncbi:Aspercryptin biosynthesis cluster-specific transcription regulator atnN [Erysiphe necator]|nr:Aspercryptin biosynthesis cluster-specific transcription regulator atnN [Erysiphe necator]KAI6251341.1 Aspercryptin biosynthesis cluster-specific transcription regulator atnN [Erysiphe necator]